MNTVQMNNEDIVIGKQQGSWLAAGILLIMFFVFIAGYFLGQQKAIEQFSVKVDQESLADKIYTSLYSVYDNPEQAKEEEEVAAVAPTDTPVKEQTLAAKQPEVQLAEASSSVPTPLHTVEKQPDEVVVQPTLYAELAGFGTHAAAQQLAQRLLKKGIAVDVATRRSKTKKGRAVTWYQVITHKVASHQELQDIVTVVQKEEHLKSIRIITS